MIWIKDLDTRIETGNRRRRWALFECSYCGTKQEKRKTGGLKARSCGCKTSELKTRITHNASRGRLYQCWADMKTRCLQKNNSRYHRYGGRGITVCEEWLCFQPFQKWAEENGYAENLTLDRIDNDSDYSPENCRWVTIQENLKNGRKNVYTPRRDLSVGKKLFASQVKEIRNRSTGQRGENRILAKEYKVSPGLIGLIINQKLWRHV